MGYTKEAIKGITWVGSIRLIVKALGFAETLILARILLPKQFGDYGVALLVLSFLEVITESGVNIILVQEKQIDKYINSAWIVSIARGIVISAMMLIMAPAISNFFNSSASLNLIYLISVVPFLRGFLNPSVIKFQKDLNFHKDFLFQLPMVVTDTIVSIVLTYYLRSPLGIGIGLVSGVAVQLALSFIFVRPLPRFELDRSYIEKILHRGKWLTASGIFNYLFHNADNIVVGKLLGTQSLGVYQIAYSLSILPVTEVADIIAKVIFPILTKLSHDKRRLRRGFWRMMLVIMVITVPYGLLLYLFPREIVKVILGDKWIIAVSIIPILSLFAVFRAITGSASTVFLSVGKQEYVTIATLVSLLGMIIPIVPLVVHFGLYGAALAAFFGSIVASPFFIYFAFKSLNEKGRS